MVEAVLNEQEPRRRPPESGADFNFLEDVVYGRRSVRYYKDKQVPEYLVRRVLETGRFAPSAGNVQTWKFVVVRDRDMIAEMTDDVVKVCKRVMKIADYIEAGNERKQWRAKALMRFMPSMFHPIPFGAMKLIAEGKLGVWHGAPTVVLLLGDKRSPGDPAIDVGIAGQNMVLTAHSYGLGTCWVSFCTPLAMLRKWKKTLGLHYPYKLYTSIAFGYPRGRPDGYVKRETQAIDWFGEDGKRRVVY
ncbi:MAG: nitroreductase family protein [bacterium]